jgi:octanoyl-[GcvH]:protein N-octanoyltransferase
MKAHVTRGAAGSAARLPSVAMLLLRDAFPADPALDLAVGHALLREVAGGTAPAVLRVYRPGPTVAFGRLDTLLPGFAAAAEAARGHGFEPVLRAPGGHAAAYDSESLCLEQVTPQPVAYDGLQERFERGAGLIAGALRELGADAHVGEVPGEYCPGRFSVHAGGVKIAGTAQRAVRGAALLGVSLVVGGGDRVRAVLRDVNAALGLEWDERTAGALEDVLPGVTVVDVEAALLRAFGAGEPGTLDAATLARARGLVERHRIPAADLAG